MNYAFGWRISSSGCDVNVSGKEEQEGLAVVTSNEETVAKIRFNRDMVKVDTFKGYTAQVSVNDKYISIHYGND